MRKIVVVQHLTVDGVMQAPGAPDEDLRGGFEHGGWALPDNDAVLGSEMGKGWVVLNSCPGDAPTRGSTPSGPTSRSREPDGSPATRREPDGSLATHADLSGFGRGFNEIVVNGRGNAYVNGFHLLSDEEFAHGVVVLVTPDGSARQVADGIAFGNGMAVTADNSTLIVAESYGNRLTAFDIADDGGLSYRRVWADLDGSFPDSICLDADGAIWYADVPNKRCVRVREGGEVLQTLTLNRGCFACMLGGPDGTTLFMLAAEWRGVEHMNDAARTGRLFVTRAPAAGVGWPGSQNAGGSLNSSRRHNT